MSFQIDFQEQGTYKSLETGITIEAILRYGNLETRCDAKIDTGSEVCLFEIKRSLNFLFDFQPLK